MPGRHHITPQMKQHLEERREELIAAVPPKMVADLRQMLALAQAAGLSQQDACASVKEALRAQQAKVKPTEKQWLVLEAGCMWLEREASPNTKATKEDPRG